MTLKFVDRRSPLAAHRGRPIASRFRSLLLGRGAVKLQQRGARRIVRVSRLDLVQLFLCFPDNLIVVAQLIRKFIVPKCGIEHLPKQLAPLRLVHAHRFLGNVFNNVRFSSLFQNSPTTEFDRSVPSK